MITDSEGQNVPTAVIYAHEQASHSDAAPDILRGMMLLQLLQETDNDYAFRMMAEYKMWLIRNRASNINTLFSDAAKDKMRQAVAGRPIEL